MEFKISLAFYEFEKERLISSRKINRYGEEFSDMEAARAAAVEEARKEFRFEDLDGCPVVVTEKDVDGVIHIRKFQEISDGATIVRITVEEDIEPYYTLPPDEDEQSILKYRTEIRGLWPSEMSESEDEFFIAKWGGADGINAIKTCPAGHEVRRVVVQNEDDIEYDDWIAVPIGTRSPKSLVEVSEEDVISTYQAIKAWWYNEDMMSWCEPVLSLYRGGLRPPL